MAKLNGKNRDRPVDRKPDDREAVVARTEGGEEIVSSQAVLNAKGAYGAIDTLAPNARLDVLIQTARAYRESYPDATVRATELAVNEVLRLRKETEAKNRELVTIRAQWRLCKDEANNALDKVEDLNKCLASERRQNDEWAASYSTVCNEYGREIGVNVRAAADRGKSRWFRLGRRLGFYR